MDSEINALRELITELVDPSKRGGININPEHVTVLHGSKSKKQISRKQRNTGNKRTTMSRREYAKLGLFALPTKQMRYEDGLPLQLLWKGYAREHLGLQAGDTVPQVHDARYDAFSRQLVKLDLHGAKLKVTESKCPTLVGLAGICVLDTKNVLKLLGKDHRIRTVPKKECIFSMQLGNMTFTIFGKHLAIRPAERSVKKIKNYVEPLWIE